MSKIVLIAILLCTSALSQTNSCPGYNTGDKMQSGKNAIMRGKIGGNPEYTYQAPINFPIPAWGLEIAVTTGTIGQYNPLPTYGYNYFIEAGRKENTNSIIYRLIMNNDQSWTSIQLSYFVSGRQDIAVGNFESPVDEWQIATANVYNIQKTLAKNLPKVNYRVAAFISGFSTTDSQFSLTINKKSFDWDKKELKVTFYSSANPAVLTLTISYIIYPQIHQILDLNYDLTPRGQIGSYQISGPVNFQPNKRIQYNQFRVQNRNLACTGNQCSNICVLREECVKLNGNIWEGQCIFCPPGVIFQFGRCSRKCGANQIYINRVCACAKGFQRKGKDCVAAKKCGTNQVWSDVSNSCICAPGCANFNNQCRQCPEGSLPTQDGKSCFCTAPDKIFDLNPFICKSRCIENQIWGNNKCLCVPRHSWWNQRCKRCPDNSDPTDDQSTCGCTSPNSYFNPETYACIECPTNYIVNKLRSDCICPQKFRIQNGQCIPDCRDNQYYNINTRTCECKEGLVKGADGLCRPKCSAGQVWQNNACVCADGFARYDSICKRCPTGSVPNDRKTACICVSANQIFSPNIFSCINCIANSSPNPTKTGCECNSGYILINGACLRDCRDPQYFQVATGNCQCKLGFVRDSSGSCKPRCPSQQIWNEQKKVCVCPEGQARYGTCKLCPSGSLPNALGTLCICTNIVEIFNPTLFKCFECPQYSKPSSDLTKCICRQGYVEQKGSCVLNCGLNQIANHDLGKCQCLFGFQKQNNKCSLRCPKIHQQWNGNECICKPGCGLRNSECSPCPAGAIPDPTRKKCLCKAPNTIFNAIKFICEQCPQNSYNAPDDSKCICNKGYEQQGNICSPICQLNQALNPKTNQCQCKYGFLRLGPLCVDRCGLNQQWDGQKCICKQNHVKGTGVCRPCPNVFGTNPKRTTCLCKDNKSIFKFDNFDCVSLPPNCGINDDFSDFNCYPGYKRDGWSCVNTCPEGATPDQTGKCVCGNGFYLDGNSCKKVIICPPNSSWNAALTSCVCDTQGQYLIQGVCKRCGQNSIFSSSAKKCICNTGFNLIGGQCRICDPRTTYNGTDCVCNLGTYGNREKCENCHQSCSKCSGPQANQCQACSDVSLILQNGFCSKNSPCDPGFFLGQSSCTKCADSCILCEDIFQCQVCANGFEIQKLQVGDQKVTACSQICGDGTRYQHECDDGNTKDGDGCSSSCNVETGWTCSGGSSAQKSTCHKFIPDATIITNKGIVNLGDRVVQGVRASYLPNCLTKNQCNECFKVLKVNVVEANVPILVKVNFVPFSQYQFLVEYDFQGAFVTSKFKTVIKLDERWKGCLADDDFSQQIELVVDPAFLARVSGEEELSVQQLDPTKPQKISLPAQAQKILIDKKK